MTVPKKLILIFSTMILSSIIFGPFVGCKAKKEKEVEEMVPLKKAPDIKQRLAKYAPTEIAYDDKILNEEDRQVLEKLIRAAKVIDTIFWKQSYPEGLALKERLEKSTLAEDKDYLHFLKINFGPFDRQDENRPFINTLPKPAGAGFYPQDLARHEFEAYVASNAEVKEEFESPFTVIKKEKDKLVAVPYSIEYREDLEEAAGDLREAAAIASNPSLKKYLSQRAVDLLSNDYFASDCLWIDLKDNLVETVIGPYEVYEDALLGLKASYECYVYINDREEMKKIKGYLDYLPEMQSSLPVELKYKDQKIQGLESPLNVVMEVFTAGDAKAGIQTSAFVLPNDEKVREKKGSKKVFLKNMMEAKFSKSTLPISERILPAEEAKRVTFSAYFAEVILHEICHALGVNYVSLPDGTKTTVNKALKELNSPLEEAKATIAGLYSVPLLIEKGLIPREQENAIYTTYLVGIFRSLRFGVKEAHGLASLLEFNFLWEKGAFNYEPESMKFKVNSEKIKAALKELAARLLILEGDGNYENVQQFIASYGQMDGKTREIINKLADIPVDIEPIFKF